MRKFIYPFICLSLSLAACSGNRTIYQNFKSGNLARNVAFKAGTSFKDADNDRSACNIAAWQQVPQNIVVGQNPVFRAPSFSTPMTTQCTNSGYSVYCNSIGGNSYGGGVYGGGTYSYDANDNLRKAVYKRCLLLKGYAFVDIPACSQEYDELAPLMTGRFPFLSEKTCYVVSPDSRRASFVNTN